ncbi:hypothetical protein [Paenibacillus faecis]|uniref:hypothetical protein n=1 Tax=Paenibacillus faecis TaxID=862114 RepID=UPI001479016F|nr:hypothetical protein [Paenibacillus faecis]
MAAIKKVNGNNRGYPVDFETKFDQAFQQAVEALPFYTDADRRKSWEHIREKLNRDKIRRKRRKQMQLAGIVAASMLIGGVIFSPPLATQAISPIYQELKNWGNGVTQLVFGNGRQTDSTGVMASIPAVQPDEGEAQPTRKSIHLVASNVSEVVKVSEEEARESLDFPLPNLTYIPERFQLQSIEIIIPAELQGDPNPFGKSAHLRYRSDQGHFLRISFDLLLQNETMTMTNLYAEKTEEVELDNGSIAYLSTGHGKAKINLMLGNVHFMAYGQVSREEILRIANGIE